MFNQSINQTNMTTRVIKVYCKDAAELESAIQNNNYDGYWEFQCAASICGERDAYMLMHRDEMG